ncbi:MAG: sensor histidine kinase [Cytophagaceae bacterium]
MGESFISKKITKILIHLLGWLCFLFYPFFLGLPFREDLLSKFFLHTILLAGFFYLNSHVLVPKFLTTRKFSYYLAFTIFIISVIVFINYYFKGILEMDSKDFPLKEINKNFSYMSDDAKIVSRSVISSLFILAVSISYSLLSEYFKNERRKKEIENQHLSSELSFLKSQVSPHFLFNTLNNIYSLTLNNSEASGAILKLSELLRYMLYESDEKEVSLAKEVKYLQNYIELQKMRIKKEVNIHLNISGDIEKENIAPMLLIPFIENAFKHGVLSSDKTYISTEIKLEGKILLVYIENNCTENTQKDYASGIGLTNVKRRLELLYPEKHWLKVERSESKFIVKLKINLGNDEMHSN